METVCAIVCFALKERKQRAEFVNGGSYAAENRW